MTRKLTIPVNVSASWRSFGLPRDVSINFWSYIHGKLPENYDTLRTTRDQNERYIKHRKVVQGKDGSLYFFLLIIDDTTSPDHLILTELRYSRKGQ